ncbi:MAG: diguanylate cyclase [Deltaproteobacteria bacterium]|jgi:diguanylate cyclase|nr:diguanylate cyclase [Deltaproteobacteria bacterium]
MSIRGSTEESENYVRLALPLMSKHDIPITPRNYTVYYTYVSGGNRDLSKAFDTIIEKGQTIDDEKIKNLYFQFCTDKDETVLRNLRNDLQQILTTILGEITEFTGQTEKFESIVSSSVAKLSEDASVQQIKSVVNEIVLETKKLGGFGNTIQDKLKETTDELEAIKKDFEKAKSEALVDFLTGIPNRKAFDEKLAKCIDEALSNNEDLCLLLIDIDHFKRFNDKYGHVVGDEVLKIVARKVKEVVRGRDFLARFGGEEFVVILPQTPLSGANTVAENIRDFFDRTKLKVVSTSKDLGKITVSIGAAKYRYGEPIKEFIDRSDQALYFAKNTGRNHVATESDVVNQSAT